MLWERIRERGKLRFVLTRGVLGWGGLMFVFMSGIGIFLHHGRFYLSLPGVAFGLLIWGTGGYLFGLWMWNWNEGQFGHTKKPRSIIED
jgi:hypothetical protein